MSGYTIESLAQQELAALTKGVWLGSGGSRHVYRMRYNEQRVVKIAQSSVWANVEERNTWEAVRGTEVERWFACVHSLTDLGVVLIQDYVPDLPCGVYRIPAFLTDLKRSNFGIGVYKGEPQVVCRDYGLHLLREIGMSKKLIRWEAT